jgi:hypothetical protein
MPTYRRLSTHLTRGHSSSVQQRRCCHSLYRIWLQKSLLLVTLSTTSFTHISRKDSKLNSRLKTIILFFDTFLDENIILINQNHTKKVVEEGSFGVMLLFYNLYLMLDLTPLFL